MKGLSLADEAGEGRFEGHCDFRCASTGLVAGSVTLHSPAPPWQRYWIELSGFALTGDLQQGIEPSSVDLLREALRCGDARTLWQYDREMAPFFCPECGLCYAASTWQAHPNSATSVDGICPVGHRRRLCAD